jgi:hypothetical protein
MKTIKLTIGISGYLNETEKTDYDGVEQKIEISCVDGLNETAFKFLSDSFEKTAVDVLNQWNNLNYDYKGVKSE